MEKSESTVQISPLEFQTLESVFEGDSLAKIYKGDFILEETLNFKQKHVSLWILFSSMTIHIIFILKERTGKFKFPVSLPLEGLKGYRKIHFLSKVAAIPDIPNKTEHFDEIVNDFASLTSNIVFKSSWDKIKIMLYNREIRLNAQKLNSSHLWRKSCISDDKIITAASIASDQNMYCAGGFKFSLDKNYFINIYWSNNNNEYILINLDDLADNCWESMHLYSKDLDHKLKLNNNIINGQHELNLNY